MNDETVAWCAEVGSEGLASIEAQLRKLTGRDEIRHMWSNKIAEEIARDAEANPTAGKWHVEIPRHQTKSGNPEFVTLAAPDVVLTKAGA